MFGKKFTDYIRFERWILIAVAAAFVIRLGMSFAGGPTSVVKWVSINLVLVVGLLYFSVAVHTTGFGSYRQLFGLLLIQNALAHFLIALALTFAVITATDNIYTAPEFFGGTSGRNMVHVAAHLIAAFVVPVFAWLLGSAILFVTKKLLRT